MSSFRGSLQETVGSFIIAVSGVALKRTYVADSGRKCKFQKVGEICQTVIKQAHPPVRRDRETAGVEGRVEVELVEGVQG